MAPPTTPQDSIAPVEESQPYYYRTLSDSANSLLKGSIGIGEGGIGLVDTAMALNPANLGRRAARSAARYAGFDVPEEPEPSLSGGLEQGIGYRPREARRFLDEFDSPELKAAKADVAKADGFIPTVVASVKNPSTVIQSAIESAPSMLAGAGVARGLLGLASGLSPVVAGAIGEGAVSAGQSASQTRRDTGTLTPTQAATAVSSGAVTGVISRLAGRVADALKIPGADPDVLMAGGRAAEEALVKRVAGGFIREGMIEELPQSAQEQVQANIASGRPWDEGVAQAAATGLLIGGVMGAGGNLRGGAATERRPSDLAEDEFTQTAAPSTPEPPSPGPEPVHSLGDEPFGAPIAPARRPGPAFDPTSAQIVLEAEILGGDGLKALMDTGMSKARAESELKRVRAVLGPKAPAAKGVDRAEDKKAERRRAEVEAAGRPSPADEIASFDADPLANAPRRREATPEEVAAYLEDAQRGIMTAEEEAAQTARLRAERDRRGNEVVDETYAPLLEANREARTAAERAFDDQTMRPAMEEARAARGAREEIASRGGPAFRLPPLMAAAVAADSIKPLVDAGVPGSPSQLRKMLEKAKASAQEGEAFRSGEEIPANVPNSRADLGSIGADQNFGHFGAPVPAGERTPVAEEARGIAERVNPVGRAEETFPAGDAGPQVERPARVVAEDSGESGEVHKGSPIVRRGAFGASDLSSSSSADSSKGSSQTLASGGLEGPTYRGDARDGSVGTSTRSQEALNSPRGASETSDRRTRTAGAESSPASNTNSRKSARSSLDEPALPGDASDDALASTRRDAQDSTFVGEAAPAKASEEDSGNRRENKSASGVSLEQVSTLVAEYRSEIESRVREIQRKEPNLPRRVIAQRINDEFSTDNRLGRGREALGRRIVDEILKGQENPKTTDRGNYPGGPVSAMLNSRKDTGPENDPERALYEAMDRQDRQQQHIAEAVAAKEKKDAAHLAEQEALRQRLEESVRNTRREGVEGQTAVAPSDDSALGEGVQAVGGAERGRSDETKPSEQPNAQKPTGPLVADEAPKAVEAHAESVPQGSTVIEPTERVATAIKEDFRRDAKQWTPVKHTDGAPTGWFQTSTPSAMNGNGQTYYYNPETNRAFKFENGDQRTAAHAHAFAIDNSTKKRKPTREVPYTAPPARRRRPAPEPEPAPTLEGLDADQIATAKVDAQNLAKDLEQAEGGNAIQTAMSPFHFEDLRRDAPHVKYSELPRSTKALARSGGRAPARLRQNERGQVVARTGIRRGELNKAGKNAILPLDVQLAHLIEQGWLPEDSTVGDLVEKLISPEKTFHPNESAATNANRIAEDIARETGISPPAQVSAIKQDKNNPKEVQILKALVKLDPNDAQVQLEAAKERGDVGDAQEPSTIAEDEEPAPWDEASHASPRFRGDAAEYTGKTEKQAGTTVHEAKITEGNRKGDFVWFTQRQVDQFDREAKASKETSKPSPRRSVSTEKTKAGMQVLLPGAEGMMDTTGRVGKLKKNQEDVNRGPLFTQDEEAEKKADAKKQGPLFSRKPSAEEPRDLILQHNLTAARYDRNDPADRRRAIKTASQEEGMSFERRGDTLENSAWENYNGRSDSDRGETTREAYKKGSQVVGAPAGVRVVDFEGDVEKSVLSEMTRASAALAARIAPAVRMLQAHVPMLKFGGFSPAGNLHGVQVSGMVFVNQLATHQIAVTAAEEQGITYHEAFARAMTDVLIHEAAHYAERGHGDAFLAELERIREALGPVALRAIRRDLMKYASDNKNRTQNARMYEKALPGWREGERRGREAAAAVQRGDVRGRPDVPERLYPRPRSDTGDAEGAGVEGDGSQGGLLAPDGNAAEGLGTPAFIRGTDGGVAFSRKPPAPPETPTPTPEELKDPTFWEKVTEWRKGAMLSSIRNLAQNAVGNVVSLAGGMAEIPFAAAADRTLNPEQRQVYMGELAASLAAFKQHGPEALGRFKQGMKDAMSGVDRLDKDEAQKFERHRNAIGGGKNSGAIEKKIGTAIRTSFRIMGVTDEFFKDMAYQQALYREAYRQARNSGLQGAAAASRVDKTMDDYRQAMGPDREAAKAAHGKGVGSGNQRAMHSRADYAAKYRTFTLPADYENAGAFGWVAKNAADFEKTVPVLGPALGLAVPFKITPAHVAFQAYERTPFAAFSVVSKFSELRDLAQKLKQSPDEETTAALTAQLNKKTEEAVNTLARAAMGSVLGAAGFALAAAGLLTGSGPPDPDDRRVWQDAGHIPNAIRIGDSWYAFDRLDPVLNVLALAANLTQASKEKDANKLMGAFMNALQETFVNNTFLDGFQRFSDMLKDPTRYGKTWLQNTEGSFVPSMVRQTAEAIDPTVRNRKGIIAPIVSGIPGLSKSLPPVRTGTGEPAKRTQRLGESVLGPLSPFGFMRTGDANGDPLAKEFLAADYAPDPHRDFISVGVGPVGLKTQHRVDLTEKELEIFRRADEAATKQLREAINSAGWGRLNADQKKAYFQRVYSAMSAQAKKAVMPSVIARLRSKLIGKK